MKKIALALMLVFVLSVSTFADGDTPGGGGRTCPEGQTCRVADNTFIKIFNDLLVSIFG